MISHRYKSGFFKTIDVPIRLLTVLFLVVSAFMLPTKGVSADNAEDLRYVVEYTTLGGTLDELTATFPPTIPLSIVEADYTINSRMTLSGDALPAGSTVTIRVKMGEKWYSYVTDVLIPDSSFWITELFEPDATAANFDANYGNKIEIYKVTINSDGNVDAVAASVKIESVITSSGVETVLAELTLPLNLPADEAAALTWLQENTVLSSLNAAISDLKATFPASIPAVIVDQAYKIDSRMTLAQRLPEGTTVTVYREGMKILSNITLSGTGPFWFTELFDPDAPRADFDADYAGAVENYAITLNGVLPSDFATTVKIESVISKDDYVTETVLDEITLGAGIPVDEMAGLAWLQVNTVLSSVSGSIADLKATFPSSIPPIIVSAPYVIDSRMTLAQALPLGTTVTIYREGFPVLSNITLPGTGPLWFTELFDPAAPRADFDGNYGGAEENYAISLSGAVPFDFETTVHIESVISKDGFATETVLDDTTLTAQVAADEETALTWLQENTLLSSVSGTLADLKATFPANIPPVIVVEDYVIDSRMTLTDELPAGTSVTVYRESIPILTNITLSGVGPFWFTQLFEPDRPRADFDGNYGGAIENYVIELNGSVPFDFATTVLIESVISKDGYSTETVLDDITLNAAIPADEAAALLAVQHPYMTLTGTLDNLLAQFPASIPPVLDESGYTINSRYTLASELPSGTIIKVIRDSATVFEGTLPAGLTTFWYTDLVGGTAAAFDAGYAGATENYIITVTGPGGNPLDFTTTVKIESIISNDGFVSNFVVLDDITLPVNIPADEAAALDWVVVNTTLTGDLSELTAAFPVSIPPVIVAEDYTINSRMTLADPLPPGSKVTIEVKVGDTWYSYVADALIPTSPFVITDLIAGSSAAAFEANYGGKVEIYRVTITNGGGNVDPIETSVKIESVIFKDGVGTILAEITLPVGVPADEAAAIAYVQTHMSVSGTLDALVAAFPETIPDVLTSGGYYIDSEIDLSEPLPTGSRVTIIRDGATIISDAILTGTGPFWITDLVGVPPSAFTEAYEEQEEHYQIVVAGNTAPIDITVRVTSTISRDFDAAEPVLVVLAEKDDLVLVQDVPGLEDALAWVQVNTRLEGTLSALRATFPVSIPQVIVEEPYQINSRITLTNALPEGSKITIVRDGVLEVSNLVLTGTQYWYTELVGVPLSAAAPFDGGYGGSVEDYRITLTGLDGKPLSFQTSVMIESVISKDGFATGIVLADIRVDTAPSQIRVYPDAGLQLITGYYWQPNTPVTLTIGQLEKEITSGDDGRVTFYNFGFPLVPGLVVEMTDGFSKRTHTIIDIAVTDINLELDRVSGTANPGMVDTYACVNNACKWIYPMSDPEGQWTADFHDLLDLTPGAEGSARQYDLEGNYTRTDWKVPAYVTLVTPTQEQHLTTSKVIFDWEDIPGVDQFDLQLSLDENFSTLLLSTTTTESSFLYPSALTNGQVYYWRVRAYFKAAWQSWSQTGVFYSMDPPLAPALISPQNSFISFGSTPVLSWNPVLNIDRYQLQISPTNTFSVVSKDVTLASEVTEYLPDPPLDNGLYYWRVRAIGTLGVNGLWSVYRWFTVNAGGPVLVNPAADGIVSGTPTYTWLAKAGATGYEVEYTFDPGGISEFISSYEVLATSHKPPTQVTGVYEWKVRAVDALGEWSEWAQRSVTISLPVPAKAVLVSPPNGAYLFVDTPVLSWNEVPYAEKYQLEISRSSTFLTIVESGIETTGTSYQPIIPENGRYYWRVRAVNKLGEAQVQYGAWSSYRYFTVNTIKPALYKPADTVTVYGTPLYRWLAKTGAKAYKFEYYRELEEGAEEVLHTSTEMIATSYRPPTQLENQTYHWRVGAKDVLGNWLWSDDRLITITQPVPAITVLDSPANGVNVFANSTTLKWKEVPYAENYQLQISKSYTFNTLIHDEQILTGTEYPVLLDNGKYYWRVRALNKNESSQTQTGAWSGYRSITLNPLGPALSAPLDGASVLGTPLYTWLGKPGAKAYRFEYFQQLEGGAENILYTSDELITTSYRPPVQAAEQTYLWRVEARDALGNWSQWSTPRTVTIQYPLPVKPGLAAPAKAAYLSDSTPELFWNKVDYGHRYQVQISTSYRFTNPILLDLPEGVLTTEGFNGMPVLPDGLYYWRVQAVNAKGETGAWSAYRTFTVDTLPQGVPLLYAPADKGFTYDTTPALSVRAVSGAKYYRFQVADASDFSNILVDSGQGAMVGRVYNVPVLNALPFREAYYWRAKSIDAALNESAWSAPRSFTVTFQNAPAFSAYTTDKTPAFSWYAVSGALGYELEIMDDPAYADEQGFPGYVKSLARVTSHTVSSLTPLSPGRYLWQLRVRTASGWHETPWRPLTITTPPLPAPILLNPASGTVLSSAMLKWEYTFTGAEKFEVWVDNGLSFTSREYQGVFGAAQTTVALPTLPPGKYYWKMRTYNVYGVPGPWSVYRYFTVSTAP